MARTHAQANQSAMKLRVGELVLVGQPGRPPREQCSHLVLLVEE